MPVFLKDDKSVLFVHIPKTGGSTIEAVFRSSGWRVQFRETRTSHPHLRPLRRVSPQHLHAPILRELFRVNRFDLVFLICREPVSRFRSEYAMRRSSEDGDFDAVEAWWSQMSKRYRNNPCVLDNHLRPQSEFLLPNAEVFRMESGLSAVVEDLNERFDLSLTTDLPHHQSSVRRTGRPSSTVPISPKLRDQLNSFYAEDFRRFGYHET